MTLSNKQVEHLAKLARIELTEEEKKQFGESITVILDYVKQLEEVDVKNVEPTSQVTGTINVDRGDKTEKCNEADALIKVAPASEGRNIKVKTVLKK